MAHSTPDPKKSAASSGQQTLPDADDIPELPALIRQTIRSDPSAGGATLGTVMGEVAAEVRSYGTEPDLVEIADAIERGIDDGRLVRRRDGLFLEEP